MREIARGVADILGFKLVDEEIILRAAAGAGVEPGVISDAERRRSFMSRMLDGLASGDTSMFGVPGGTDVTPAHLSAELRELIRSAIEETAEAGEVVIVAHAASHALAARPDVLRVLVSASLETRRSRVARPRAAEREGRCSRCRFLRLGAGRLPEALLRHEERVADPVRPRPEHRPAHA